MPFPSGALSSEGGLVEDAQKQQVAVWLQSLGLQHLVARLQQSSLLTIKDVQSAESSLLMNAGCTADEAQVISSSLVAHSASHENLFQVIQDAAAVLRDERSSRALRRTVGAGGASSVAASSVKGIGSSVAGDEGKGASEAMFGFGVYLDKNCKNGRDVWVVSHLSMLWVFKSRDEWLGRAAHALVVVLDGMWVQVRRVQRGV